ncbi:MAG TPA: hypothetical protein VL993_07195 [Stellaceae bacterium]|nr:hypothetical protein [Stellaceae bacterium]
MPALLIVHMLLAVALIGAVTHQSLGAIAPADRPASFFARYRAVKGEGYVNAIIVLYLVTATLGLIIYPNYRIGARLFMEQLHDFKRVGSFELKEHLIAIGFCMLPAYWWAWQPAQKDYAQTRRALTIGLGLIVWYAFLIGHILNNTQGIS